MKQYETRVEYMNAIAQAIGLEGIDDLAAEHRNVLQVERFERLPTILTLVEMAAGQYEPLPFTDDDTRARLTTIRNLLEVKQNAEPQVKAVQKLIGELLAIIEPDAGTSDVAAEPAAFKWETVDA